MKSIKILFTSLSLVALLSGCGNNNNTNPSGDEYPTVEFDDADKLQIGGSYGGFFDEIAIARSFAPGIEYELSFTSSYHTDPSFTVMVSNPSLVDITMGTGSKFYMTPKKLGDFIMYIEDAQGMLCYRNKVMIRQGYTAEEVPEKLFSVDRFLTNKKYAWTQYEDWTLTFTSASPLQGTLFGSDDAEQNAYYNFTVEYESYSASLDCYYFNATASETNSTFATAFGGFYVSRTCDFIVAFDNQISIGALYASN